MEKNDTEGDALMTMAEVAALWKCSADTVRRRVKAGVLPTVPVGTGVRIRRTDALKGAQ
ncbi:excisionase family DNA-binding protein [Mycobacterium sp. 20091114027_K0903767]|nr:excisionase family DNA-binding protein [Mycobacterium sp. 20091114027_K0903767]